MRDSIAGNFNFANARTDGYNIRFMAADGITELAFEREHHNIVADKAEYWVKIPFVSVTVNASFFMHYGKTDTVDGANPIAVWDMNFISRWSLVEVN